MVGGGSAWMNVVVPGLGRDVLVRKGDRDDKDIGSHGWHFEKQFFDLV